MFKTTAIAVAAVAALAFAAPAVAQSNGDLSLSQIETRLSAQGFRVLEIERDDGYYEVKAVNSAGACVELDVNRRTGEIVRTESDDDCETGASHRNGADHGRRNR